MSDVVLDVGIGPGFESGYSSNFGPSILDELLYFSANDGINVHGIEIWRSEGPGPRNILLRDLNLGPPHGVLPEGSY